MTDLTDREMEQFIREAFEENFELLRLESGVTLSPDVKEAALQQVLLYWLKLRNVAENVSETEVKLNLPSQTTPKGREFGIEGVVDIVRDNNRTIMYDIKTHDAEYVRTHTDLYEGQLNVYAHIWQNLRGKELNETAIIATAYPETMKEALSSNDATYILQEMMRWDPLVPIDFSQDRVEETIQDFAEVVDAIEDGVFAPPDVDVLRERLEGTNTLYATRVCRNCDARYSCDAYRRYTMDGRNPSDGSFFRLYLQDSGSDADRDDWLNANLDAQGSVDGLGDIF